MELPDCVTGEAEHLQLFWRCNFIEDIEMLFSSRKNRIILLNIEQGLTI